MGDYLDTLSEFVADTRYQDLSEDTVGAILAGSRLPENANLAQQVAERSGPATAIIFGHPLKAEPMLATLVNATAGVGLEMDEGNKHGGGHPSIHVMPAALAVGEQMSIDGHQFIEAMLVAYEVESRMGAATIPRPNVHSHGHWGVIGTAVAIGKLNGLDAGQMRSLINVASGMSPANTWRPCFEGATIRNAYPGRSGLMGILAMDMYRAGFTGVEDGPSDVFGTIIGDSFDPDGWWRNTTDIKAVFVELVGLVNVGLGFPLRPEQYSGPGPAHRNPSQDAVESSSNSFGGPRLASGRISAKRSRTI